MSDPLTLNSAALSPLLTVSNHTDGVRLQLRSDWLVLPPQMAVSLAQALTAAAQAHDASRVTPLPTVTPKGEI